MVGKCWLQSSGCKVLVAKCWWERDWWERGWWERGWWEGDGRRVLVGGRVMGVSWWEGGWWEGDGLGQNSYWIDLFSSFFLWPLVSWALVLGTSPGAGRRRGRWALGVISHYCPLSTIISHYQPLLIKGQQLLSINNHYSLLSTISHY